MKNLLDEFLDFNPNFLSRIEKLPKLSRERLIKKFKQEKDKNNFRSTVSEVRFAELFMLLDIDFEYDKSFPNKQTPDFSIFFDKTEVICDVYKLGNSQEDQFYHDFENELISELKKVNSPYTLRISHLSDEIIYKKINIFGLVNEIDNWLKESEKLSNDFKVFKEIVMITIEECNSKNGVIGNYKFIDIKPHKVEQKSNFKDNEITKKLNKYNDIIKENDLLYFLCIDIGFTSGFDRLDIKERFLGGEVHFIDYGTPAQHINFRHMGEYTTQLGEFYNLPHLTGVIINDNEQFYLLLNPLTKQLDENKKLLLDIIKRSSHITVM